MNLQIQLKQLVAKGKIEEVIDMLSSLQTINSDIENELVGLKREFKDWKRNSYIGIYTNEESRVSRSKLDLHILKIIDELKESKEELTPIEETDTIRAILTERYKNLLEQGVSERLAIPLELEYTDRGFERYEFLKVKTGKVSEVEGLLGSLRRYRHLLVIGEEGCGKTRQILELAKNWLTNKITEKLPILFNLASWKPRNGYGFHQWLEDALFSGYGFSKQLAKEVITNGQIIPILDGLNEVGKDLDDDEKRNERRCECLSSISEFLYSEKFNVDYSIITSRTESYEKLSICAPVRAAVLVHTPKVETIKKTLKHILEHKDTKTKEGASTKLLEREDIAANALFKELKKIDTHPLFSLYYYNLRLNLLYNPLKKPSSTTQSTNFSFPKEFIQEKLKKTSIEEKFNFPKKQTLKTLSWLAKFLKKESKVAFELTDFQSSHLKYPLFAQVIYILLYIGVGIFVGFCVGELASSSDNSLVKNIYEGMKIGFVFGISFIILRWNLKIKTEDIQKFKPYAFFSNIGWKKGLFEFLFIVVLGVIIGGFVGELEMDKNTHVNKYTDKERGLIGGLVFGFVFGLSRFLINRMITVSSFSLIRSAYFRLNNEIPFKILKLAIPMLIAVLAGNYANDSIKEAKDFYIWLSLGTFVGLVVGFLETAWYRYVILRFFLWCEGSIPFRFGHFLNYATEAQILKQSGGQWSFRHQLLQDFFAENNEKSASFKQILETYSE